MKHEYEMVSHGHGAYRLFLVELVYRTPHMHRDFEISWILDGKIHVALGTNRLDLKKGDVFLANPYDSHELRASAPVPILSLQISPSFFSSYFKDIENLRFEQPLLPSRESAMVHRVLYQLALRYWQQPSFYELDCAAILNCLFHSLFLRLPYTVHSDQELNRARRKGDRMRSLINYINTHYEEKMLLTELAEREGLSLHYLSHLFQESLGMPFQEYLSRIRCEKARRLLLSTDQTLLDIGIACGFSDPKYFNRDFRRQYGFNPKEYRQRAASESQYKEKEYSFSEQDFLSPQVSLVLLHRIAGTEYLS